MACTIRVPNPCVIRFSIGFQNQWGFRRQQTSLSYLDIQRYARISDRTTLGDAIRSSVKSNYIRIMDKGYFDPKGGVSSRKATYAVRWLNDNAIETIGRKTRLESESEMDHSENPTGIGRKSQPADRSENPTGLQITEINNTLKQQPPIAATLERLKAEGFDGRAAEAIASNFPAERIERQIRWIDLRTIKSNRLGLLRASIDQDWAEPISENLRRRKFEGNGTGVSFAEAVENAKGRRGIRSSPVTVAIAPPKPLV